MNENEDKRVNQEVIETPEIKAPEPKKNKTTKIILGVAAVIVVLALILIFTFCRNTTNTVANATTAGDTTEPTAEVSSLNGEVTTAPAETSIITAV